MPRRFHNPAQPLIIAHRGASGLRPEHTLEAYELALRQGADVIEPDLVPSADGVLYARHEAGLARSTDIASRTEFRDRQRDGDWRCDAFSSDELDTLRAIQPSTGRPREFDGLFALPRWQAILEWAALAASRRDKPVILYPELKCPAEFIANGVDPVEVFIDSEKKLPGNVNVWVQCFQVESLRRVHDATGLPCCLLVDAAQDWRECLRAHGAWLARLGVDKELLNFPDGASGGLLELAHGIGLRVDAWTFRDDRIDSRHANARDEIHEALVAGVDGVFCDFPPTGVAARDRLRNS